MPGGDGQIGAAPGGEITRSRGNQLVRTRNSYAAHGLAVLVIDASTSLAAAVDYMSAIKRPVTVVATSRGTLRAAEGIAGGARPDRLVLTSGFLSSESGSSANVESILGRPPPCLARWSSIIARMVANLPRRQASIPLSNGPAAARAWSG